MVRGFGLGYEASEAVGRKGPDFLTPESRVRAIRNETLPLFWRTGHARSIGYRFLRKSGDVIDLLLDAELGLAPRWEPSALTRRSTLSSAMKRLVLGGQWVSRRLKAVRFALIALPRTGDAARQEADHPAVAGPSLIRVVAQGSAEHIGAGCRAVPSIGGPVQNIG